LLSGDCLDSGSTKLRIKTQENLFGEREEGRMAKVKALTLRLTPDELLVLYHFLLRYTTRHEYQPENAGEDLVLEKVCLALCDAVRPAADYEEQVAAARERVYQAWDRSVGRRPRGGTDSG
jgi:hypothetical protein